MVIKNIRGSDYFHSRIREVTSSSMENYLSLINITESHLKNTKVDIIIKSKGGAYMTVKTPRIVDKKTRKLVEEEIKSYLNYERKYREDVSEQIILRKLIETFSQAMEDKKQLKQNEVLTCTNKFDLGDEKFLVEYATSIGKPMKLHESKFAVLFEPKKIPKVKEK